MDRVNGSDWVDIGGGRRGFRSQNAAAGVPGTEVTDKILNDVQEEICAVIEKAGFVLDPDNQQQLWEALQAIAAPGFANRTSWLPVLSMAITNPPDGSALGDAYIIPAGASGAWSGHQQKLAEWTGASWRIVSTRDGHGVSLPNGQVFEKIGGVYVEKIALDVQSAKWSFTVAGGTPTALTANVVPTPPLLTAGMVVRLQIAAENTGPVTLNLNGLGARPILTQKGQPLRMGDLPAGMIATIIFTGTSWLLAGVAYSEFKQILTDDLTLWVRPDGDDNNNGSANNVANAFKTLDGAWNYIVNRFDPGNRTITIRLGVAGTYDGFLFTPYAGQVVVMGDPTAPSDNYTIRCRPGESYVVMSSVTTLDIVNCVLSFTYNGADKPGGEWIVAARQGGQVNLIGCRYRLNNNRDSLIINAVDSKCVITVGGSIHIQGGFKCSHFVQVVGGGVFLGGIQSRPASIILAAGQTYNSYFCQAAMSGLANWAYTTFGGTTNPTGFRYSCSLNGVISTNGGGENFLPGSAAGVKETGGQYV